MKEHNAVLVADNFVFLEAPRWDEDRLWVSDVYDEKLLNVYPDGRCTHICDVPGRPLGIGLLPDGTAVVVSSGDKKVMQVMEGTLSVYADLSDVAAGNVNDLVVDSDGRIYVGNFGYDLLGGAPKALTDLHVIQPDRSIQVAASGLEFPNGAIIKDDGHTLVVAETWLRRLTAFDRAPDGSLSNRRVYAELGQHQPDGICVDAEGGIWVGGYDTGEFIRVLDGGEVTDRVKFDGLAIACVLGGADGKTLYCSVFHGSEADVMTKQRRGALYAVQADVPGPTA